MHCAPCRCDYPEWLRSCPACGAALEPSPPIDTAQGPQVGYAELVERVVAAGGSLSIELSTTAVGIEQTWRFFYRGFGCAWAERMSGRCEDLAVELKAVEVGRHRRSFLLHYIGYGFAWTKQLDGVISGNPAHLEARKVEMDRKTRFPYLGYGFAWTQEMGGTCGDRLELALVTTEVVRKQRYGFPYQGYGFAWARGAQLTIQSR